jgi:hypothetical protein
LSFSSSDQRRRRPVSTTSSRSTWALRLSHKDNSQQHASFGKAAFTVFQLPTISDNISVLAVTNEKW